MTTPSQHYLRDVLPELLSRARTAREESRRAVSADPGFAAGRAQAYYEVVSHLLGQLQAFGIDRAAVGIDQQLDVERDLL